MFRMISTVRVEKYILLFSISFSADAAKVNLSESVTNAFFGHMSYMTTIYATRNAHTEYRT